MNVVQFLENNEFARPYSFQEFLEKSKKGVFDDGNFSAEITASNVVIYVADFKNITVASLKEGLITAYGEYLKYSYN